MALGTVSGASGITHWEGLQQGRGCRVPEWPYWLCKLGTQITLSTSSWGHIVSSQDRGAAAHSLNPSGLSESLPRHLALIGEHRGQRPEEQGAPWRPEELKPPEGGLRCSCPTPVLQSPAVRGTVNRNGLTTQPWTSLQNQPCQESEEPF